MYRIALCAAMLATSAALTRDTALLADDKDDKGKKDAAQDRITLALDAGGHTDNIGRVAFSPDGRTLLSGGHDGTVRVWDVQTGQCVRVIRTPGRGDCGRMALSPDGKSVAVAGVYYYPDEKREYVVFVLSVADGTLVRTLRGHTDHVIDVAYRADGKRLASAAHDGTLRIWDTADGAQKASLKVDVSKPASGPWLAGHLAYAPDGKRIAYTTDAGECHVIGVGMGKEFVKLVSPVKTSRIFGARWSPDGKSIVTCSNSECQLWAADGTAVRKLHGGATSAAFTPDSARVLVTWLEGTKFHRATLYESDSGKEVAAFAPTTTQPGFGQPLDARACALAPTGDWAATAGGDRGTHEIFLWKLTGDEKPGKGKAAKAKPREEPDRRLAARSWYSEDWKVGWTADGKGVVLNDAANKEGTVRAFSLADLKMSRVPQKEAVYASEKQGARTIAFDSARYAHILVKENGKEISSFGMPTRAHRPYGHTFVGKDVVAVGGDWAGFYLFDAASGKQIREFRSLFSPIATAAASPGDTKYIVTAGTDQILRVWNPTRDFPVLYFYANGPDWVAWTGQGYYACSTNGERLIGWKVDHGIDATPDYFPAEQFRAQLHRPDVIKLVLEAGHGAAAVKAANAAIAKAEPTRPAPRAVSNPAELLPPGVTLAVDQSKNPLVTVTVTAKAAAAGQNVQSLRLLIDGRRVKGTDGKDAVVEFPAGKAPAQAVQTWTVELPPGRHAVSALARSTDDTPSFSPPQDVLAPAAAGQKPKLHVLAVGISQYQIVRPNLRFADTDAQNVTGAFDKLTRTSLAYQKGTLTTLTNAQATTAGVKAALAAVKVEPGDLFVFFFAGHGTRDEGEFFLVTHDTNDANPGALRKTALSGSDVRAALADFPCQVLMVLDACHGGQIAGMPAGDDEAARRLAAADARVAVMCAALGHETSKEDPALKAGVFTHELAKVLSDPKKVDAFYDHKTGELNVYHLHAWVYQEVTRKPGPGQTPFLKMPLGHPAFTVNLLPVAAPPAAPPAGK
jgi:WD40 repeat protein